MRFTIKALAFVTLFAGLSSCVSKKKYEELSASKVATDAQLAQTRTDLKNLQGENDALEVQVKEEQGRVTTLNSEVASLRSDLDNQSSKLNDLNTRLTATEAELESARKKVAAVFDQYKSAGLDVTNRDGQLYISTSAPINFASGSARLSRAEREAIDALAAKLAGTNVPFTIVGHADAQKGMNNWDLSYRRAKAVANRLIRKGVSAEQLTVAGRAEFEPVGDNTTKDGRAQNRRTELKPNPALGNFINN